METERIHELDAATRELFDLKGQACGTGTLQEGDANAVKVRRVMQITRDLAQAPFDRLRILDLACGEGVYSIEAALRGAEVVGLDARTERLSGGASVAERLGLHNLRFDQADIRKVDLRSHGEADVVYLLGILYHLDGRDIVPVLRNIHELCRRFVIIDTHIALHGRDRIEHEGRSYDGRRMREHGDHDPAELRRSRLTSSLDNPFAFWFTRESLFRLLHDVGFTSVFACDVPWEPFKPPDRITLVAARGQPVKLSCYPWVNDKAEDEIGRILGARRSRARGSGGPKAMARSVIDAVLRPFGFEIRRI